MERLKLVHKLGSELKKFEPKLKEPLMIADLWVEKEKQRESFFDDSDKETLMFIASIVDIEKIDDPCAMVDALIAGKSKIQETFNFLLKIGYSYQELKKYYERNLDAFSCEKSSVEGIIAYFKELGLNSEEIKTALLDAVKIGSEETRNRSELALTCFGDKEFLVFLIRDRILFYPYHYVDVISALKRINSMFGAQLSRLFLIKNIYFLRQYKREEYKKQYDSQYADAVEAIAEFKKRITDAIAELNDANEREILEFHFNTNEETVMPVEKTAEKFCISKERVEQLISKICRKIRDNDNHTDLVECVLDNTYAE